MDGYFRDPRGAHSWRCLGLALVGVALLATSAPFGVPGARSALAQDASQVRNSSARGAGENWPAWRGPRADGTSGETGLPGRWSRDQNVVWRAALPGPAGATPIVWEDRIFLTSVAGEDLLLMSLSTSGEVLWKRTVDSGNYDVREGEGSAATPSPVTDGKLVWALFGTGQLACFDFSGEEIWSLDLEDELGEIDIKWGYSSAPLLHGDRLYLQLLHAAAQQVVALDKSTGEVAWRHERATDAREESRQSYASPILLDFDGQEQILTHGADYLVAHDTADGSEIWRCGGFQKPGAYRETLRFVATPVFAEGLIVAPSAQNGPVLAIDPRGARGDITRSDHVRWIHPRNTPDVPSPLIHDGLVYLCRETGVLTCLDAETGEAIYRKRAYKQQHRASPVLADGQIYLSAIDGTVTVIEAGREYRVVGRNELGERIASSPAISNGRIYIRTYEALYAFAEQSELEAYVEAPGASEDVAEPAQTLVGKVIQKLKGRLEHLVTLSWWPTFFGLLGFTIALMLMEAFFLGWNNSSLRRLLRPTRTGRMDLLFYIFGSLRISQLLVIFFSFGMAYLLRKGVERWLDIEVPLLLRFDNFYVQHIVLYIVMDFLFYWGHRLEHNVPFLWEFHKFHHSAEEFNMVTVDRVHPAEGFYLGAFTALPAAILGAPAESFLGLTLFRMFISQMHHSMVPWKWGWLGRYVFVSPIFHRIHHSDEPRHFNKNYAGDFVIWDYLFGSAYEGPDVNQRVGVDDNYFNRRGIIYDLFMPYVKAFGHVRAGVRKLLERKRARQSQRVG